MTLPFPGVKRKRNPGIEDLIDSDGEASSDRGSNPIEVDCTQASRTTLRQLTTEECLTDDVLDLCCRAI